MKTTTLPKKTAAAKKSTARPAAAPAGSITLPLQQVPLTWRRAAKDGNFPSVEAWAAVMLDVMSWPGDRITLTMTHEKLDRWSSAGRAKGQNFYEWVETTLDAASQAVKGGLS